MKRGEAAALIKEVLGKTEQCPCSSKLHERKRPRTDSESSSDDEDNNASHRKKRRFNTGPSQDDRSQRDHEPDSEDSSSKDGDKPPGRKKKTLSKKEKKVNVSYTQALHHLFFRTELVSDRVNSAICFAV